MNNHSIEFFICFFFFSFFLFFSPSIFCVLKRNNPFYSDKTFYSCLYTMYISIKKNDDDEKRPILVFLSFLLFSLLFKKRKFFLSRTVCLCVCLFIVVSFFILDSLFDALDKGIFRFHRCTI